MSLTAAAQRYVLFILDRKLHGINISLYLNNIILTYTTQLRFENIKNIYIVHLSYKYYIIISYQIYYSSLHIQLIYTAIYIIPNYANYILQLFMYLISYFMLHQ